MPLVPLATAQSAAPTVAQPPRMPLVLPVLVMTPLVAEMVPVGCVMFIVAPVFRVIA